MRAATSGALGSAPEQLGRPAPTADAVAARVVAFRELKNVVDDEVRLEIEGGGGNPVAGALTRIRGVLPF